MGSWQTWVAGIFFLAATADGAHAQFLPPDAVFTQNMNVDVTGSNINPYRACGGAYPGINCTGEGSLSAGGFPAEPYYGAQASFSGYSSPTVNISASAASRGYGVANTFSDVVYSFEWNGPNGVQTIPVSIAVLLQARSTVDATDPYAQTESFASYRLSQAGADVDFLEEDCNRPRGVLGPGCQSSGFNGTLNYDLTPNTVYNVELKVFADASDALVYGLAGPHGLTTPTASANADPHIFLDPDFSFADQYELVLSAGISNVIPTVVPPVPEPETWALMLIGLAGLGMAPRRCGQPSRRT